MTLDSQISPVVNSAAPFLNSSFLSFFCQSSTKLNLGDLDLCGTDVDLASLAIFLSLAADGECQC